MLLVLVLPLSIAVLGCGPTEELAEEETEDWEATPTVSPEAKLEYRVDSLLSENRRMRDQVDAVSAENRGLRARVAELETKLSEATSAAQAPVTPAPMTASGDMRSAYQAALDQFMGRNYQGAIDQFQSLLQADINRDLADNCHYWIGESYYALQDYNQAIQQFQQVFNFPGSGKSAYAQLMIGNAYAALGNSAAAREAYTAVVNSYPTSGLVAKAQEKIARLR
jgi:tol-pal system protein YbgF